MRTTFIETLVDLAERDPRLVLLTGDLGYLVVERFAERFPDRFYNVGVAEQNMIGIATGLAEAGFIPFAYSIATFAALRPYEFIRNGPVLHQLPARIVAVGGGFEYGAAGITHHALEDLALMRVQPGLTVIAPADAAQTETALRQTYDLPAPIYFRLGKNDRERVPGLDGRFELGAAQVIREGADLALIATGAIAIEAAAAADQLAQVGIQAAVIIVASIQPAPAAQLASLLSSIPLAVTVEAHYINGGLGSLVAEVIAEHGLACRLMRAGIRQPHDGRSGGQHDLQRKHGLDAASLAAQVRLSLEARP